MARAALGFSIAVIASAIKISLSGAGCNYLVIDFHVFLNWFDDFSVFASLAMLAVSRGIDRQQLGPKVQVFLDLNIGRFGG